MLQKQKLETSVLPPKSTSAKKPAPAPPAVKVSKHQTFTMVRMLRSAIHEHPKNPRTITESAKKKLRDKIKDVGLLQPVIFNKRSGYLLGGHQRLVILDNLEHYKPGSNDYYLDVSVVDLDEKQELEALVFLNNASGMGQWNIDMLADLANSVSFEGMGFDKVDLELLFDGDARFDDLLVDTAPARDAKDSLQAIKEERAAGSKRMAEAAGIDWYVMVVCKDQSEKERLMKHLNIPKGEVYISPNAIFALVRN